MSHITREEFNELFDLMPRVLCLKPNSSFSPITQPTFDLDTLKFYEDKCEIFSYKERPFCCLLTDKGYQLMRSNRDLEKIREANDGRRNGSSKGETTYRRNHSSNTPSS